MQAAKGKTSLILARVDHFNNGAVIVERCATTECGDGSENILHRSLLGCGFETLVVKELPDSIFGLCDAVGDQNQAVAVVKIAAITFIGRARQQAYRKVTVRGPNDFATADHQGLDVAAVDVLQLTIFAQSGQHQRGVLFSDVFVSKEVIDGSHDFSQAYTSGKLRIDHALQGGSQQRG